MEINEKIVGTILADAPFNFREGRTTLPTKQWAERVKKGTITEKIFDELFKISNAEGDLLVAMNERKESPNSETDEAFTKARNHLEELYTPDVLPEGMTAAAAGVQAEQFMRLEMSRRNVQQNVSEVVHAR